MEPKTYDKLYYNNIWNKILGKYTPDSPVYDLGDIARQYYVGYFMREFLSTCNHLSEIRIIDFGAGNWLYLGELLGAMAEYNIARDGSVSFELIGVDYSAEALKFGIQKYKDKIPANVKIETLSGEINCIAHKIDQNSCDLILSLETLEHLYEDKQFMYSVGRLVKPGGVVIFSTPNEKPTFLSRNWFIYVFFQKKFSEKDLVVGHLRRYNVCEFAKEAHRMGLKFLEYKCYGFVCSDYLKLLSNCMEKHLPVLFLPVFRFCRSLMLAENRLFNRMKCKNSEGIFVYLKKGEKE